MPATLSSRPARILLFVIGIAALVWTLAVVIFGVVDLVTQLADHTIRPTMYWATNYTRFTDEGNGHSGVKISGDGGAVTTSVTGVSGSTVALFTAASVVRLLIQLTLGALAVTLLERLRSGTPFRDAAWRLVAALSVVVLALGVVGQLLDWWSRVAIIDDAGGESFSRAFVFEPLTISIGVTLALVAAAFRVGERLQRDADGLV